VLLGANGFLVLFFWHGLREINDLWDPGWRIPLAWEGVGSCQREGCKCLDPMTCITELLFPPFVSAAVRDNAAYNVEASASVCAKLACVGCWTLPLLPISQPHPLTELSRVVLRELVFSRSSLALFSHAQPEKGSIFSDGLISQSWDLLLLQLFSIHHLLVRCPVQLCLGDT